MRDLRVERAVTLRTELSPSGDAVDHGVSDPFRGEQNESENRKSDLEAFGIELFLCDGLLTPLCRGLVSQAPDFAQYIEIDDCAEEGEKHHGDADGVLMEAARGGVDACGGG